MNCVHESRRQYSYAFGRRTAAMCQACLASVSALGMVFTLIERRVEDVRPMVERRNGRPAWLSRLTARDDTGRIVA